MMMRVFTLLATAVAVCGLASFSPAAPKDDKNKDKSDVKDKKWVTTATGLQYLDEKVGTGATVKAGDRAEVHYTGTFKDGKKFDSSKDRGQPFTVPVGAGQVIKGWDEGLVGMKVGGTRKLIIPYQLAYGEAGRPPTIPPKSELHFEIELLKIK
jgi:FKBP-type peptidyl-prolyl cis-trans isomerase